MSEPTAEPVLHVLYADPASLIPYHQNTKAHSHDQIEDIARQIKAVGMVQPIVVQPNLVILAGHGRREAAILMGLKQVPYVITDVSDEVARAYRIADNRVAESPWMADMLQLELIDLKSLGVSLDATGFRESSLGDFLTTGFLPSSVFDPRVLGGDFNQVSFKERLGAEEMTPDEFSDFEHQCPKCGFEFNHDATPPPPETHGALDAGGTSPG